ncbi:ribonuclease HI family protein, partial [Salmonella enterica subsp. enterica serovar Typhi]|uniref:ribonuclease HI family protein n=1 Tax=Salmonella enterica TaxID=28901 RepID=UPI0019158DB5
YALRFCFTATNNEAEYEAMIAGLELARKLGVQNLKICSDSQLVVKQILGEYKAKDRQMEEYLTLVQQQLKFFPNWSIERIPRSKNTNADALSKLASSVFSH